MEDIVESIGVPRKLRTDTSEAAFVSTARADHFADAPRLSKGVSFREALAEADRNRGYGGSSIVVNVTEEKEGGLKRLSSTKSFLSSSKQSLIDETYYQSQSGASKPPATSPASLASRSSTQSSLIMMTTRGENANPGVSLNSKGSNSAKAISKVTHAAAFAAMSSALASSSSSASSKSSARTLEAPSPALARGQSAVELQSVLEREVKKSVDSYIPRRLDKKRQNTAKTSSFVMLGLSHK